MRFLILGGTGFAGTHLARACLDAGDEVFVTGRDPERSPSLRSLGARVRALRADVLDEESVRTAVEEAKPDRVVHLAGLASVASSLNAEDAYYRTNMLGTLHVLRSVRAAAPEARVLYVGSADEYGRVPPERQPIREDAELAPVSPYGVSRAAGSLVAKRFALAEGLHVVRTRSFNHTGAGQKRDFALPDWADQLVRARLRGEKRAEVETGDLSVERDYSGVRAVVGAYRALLEKGTSGDVFNVCSGRPRVLGSLLARLGELAGVEPLPRPAAARMRRAEVRTVRGDPSRLEATTGLSLAETLDVDLEGLVRATEERLRGGA